MNLGGNQLLPQERGRQGNRLIGTHLCADDSRLTDDLRAGAARTSSGKRDSDFDGGIDVQWLSHTKQHTGVADVFGRPIHPNGFADSAVTERQVQRKTLCAHVGPQPPVEFVGAISLPRSSTVERVSAMYLHNAGY